MNDKEKFACFAEKLAQDNESKYGAEIRAKYGDAAVDKSNAKVKGMTEAQYKEYLSDPRFTAYYDKIAPGCAVFLRDALLIFC